MKNVVCFAGDEDDSVHAELETERDGPLAGYLCHGSRYVTFRNTGSMM